MVAVGHSVLRYSGLVEDWLRVEKEPLNASPQSCFAVLFTFERFGIRRDDLVWKAAGGRFRESSLIINFDNPLRQKVRTDAVNTSAPSGFGK